MPEASPSVAFDQGHWAGVVDTTLQSHEARLVAINGSIERAATNMAALATEVSGLREDARVREERVITAANVLAQETEARRLQIADEKSADNATFSRRERILSLGFAAAGTTTAVLAALSITAA